VKSVVDFVIGCGFAARSHCGFALKRLDCIVPARESVRQRWSKLPDRGAQQDTQKLFPLGELAGSVTAALAPGAQALP
jgi:hypothetical protein